MRGKKSKDAIWVYGVHACGVALCNEKRPVMRLAILLTHKDVYSQEAKIAQSRGVRVEYVDHSFFLSISAKDAQHQGIALLIGHLEAMHIEDIVEDESDKRPLVILDQVTDPQNIGAIVRSCAAFSVRAVIMPQHASPQITASMYKVASGGFEFVPIIYAVNISQAMAHLKRVGFWCVGLAEDAPEEIGMSDLKRRCAFVIGNEGDGMRRLTREACDFCVRFPCSDQFATLNAAHSASIALYEYRRQTGY